MADDKIEVTFSDDGTVKFKTDAISEANHSSAEDILKRIEDSLTETPDTQKRHHGHTHGKQKQHIKH